MCTSHIAVQTRADDDRYTAGDPSTMADMRCGILRKSNVVALYSSWCAENGLTPHIVEYDSLDQRNDALAAGEVDAIAAGSTVEGAQKIAEFPSLDLFFMFNSRQAALKAQLDRAMSILSLENPTYAQELFAKYFPASRNSAPSFSAEEKAFIAAHPAIRVAVLADDAPFSRKSGQTAQGILPSYFDHLSDVTGIRFTCVPFASADDAYAALADGAADMVGKAEDDAYAANSRGVILSTAYAHLNLVTLTKAGTGQVSAAAVPACNEKAVRLMLAGQTPAVSVKICANTRDCFSALRDGAVDGVICPQSSAAWLLNRNRASEYTVSAFGDSTWDVACSLPRSDAGNELRSILDKSIAVDHGYINQLIASDTLRDSASLSTLMNRLPVSGLIALVIAAVLLLIIISVALVVIIRHQRTERLLTQRQAELAIAAEANRSKHAFFGSVSHDMRTPLNGIMGFTELGLRSSSPEEMKDCLRKIQISGNVLSRLVDDTLVMSRLESGSRVLTPALGDLTQALDEVAQVVRPMAEAKGVTYSDNLAELGPRFVELDRAGLQKIFLNLLSNAVKFTPAGGSVTFRCVPSGAETVFTVSDTGIGMSGDFLPKAFEPFAQEAGGISGTQGSGMGLAIVKSLVDAMGGTVALTSRKGEGTGFTVRLPLPPCDPPPAPADAGDPAARLKGKRVLVCEDNALNMEIIQAILTEAGMETVGAENGRLGVDAFAASPAGTFDFVLLDLRMPVMDGNAAARAIRALERPDAAAVPIFAVSADAYPENREESLAAGMNGHIAKPIDGAALLSAMAAAL